MKQIFFSVLLLTTMVAYGQADKSQRPSPPALAKETLNNGTTVSIDYSQPAVKGRTIGTELEPRKERSGVPALMKPPSLKWTRMYKLKIKLCLPANMDCLRS